MKNGAAIACVTTFGGGIGMPRTPPMYIKSFVSPKSYGVWDGTTPQNEIGFFVSKVRFSLSFLCHVVSFAPDRTYALAFRDRSLTAPGW